MSRIHIVTDSSAQFTQANFAKHPDITILPNRLTIGDKVYYEGVDISAEEALQLIATQSTPPNIEPPTVEDYAETYARLSRTYDTIISIHASKALFRNWYNAQTAAQQMDNILLVDTQMMCVAQGILVQLAVEALAADKSADDIVREVRGAVERLYAVYYVEKLSFLGENQIMSPSHTTLGMLLGVKPFLTMEYGLLTPIEKVKTRTQALERLIEYAIEFTDVEELVILQHKASITEQTRLLQERLTQEFPSQQFNYMVYSPSLAALIGSNASGIVIFEEELEEHDI